MTTKATRGKNGRFKAKFKMGILHYGALATAIMAICVLVVYLSGGLEGCYKTKANVTEIPDLRNRINYLFQVRLLDSIGETQRIDDLYDSLYDHREAIGELQYFKNKNFIVR